MLRLYPGAGKPVFQAVIKTVEECRPALQHLPGQMQFMLVNDGWRGGDMRKCHKDTSVSQTDVLERAFREEWRVKNKLNYLFSKRYVEMK